MLSLPKSSICGLIFDPWPLVLPCLYHEIFKAFPLIAKNSWKIKYFQNWILQSKYDLIANAPIPVGPFAIRLINETVRREENFQIEKFAPQTDRVRNPKERVSYMKGKEYKYLTPKIAKNNLSQGSQTKNPENDFLYLRISQNFSLMESNCRRKSRFSSSFVNI